MTQPKLNQTMQASPTLGSKATTLYPIKESVDTFLNVPYDTGKTLDQTAQAFAHIVKQIDITPNNTIKMVIVFERIPDIWHDGCESYHLYI